MKNEESKLEGGLLPFEKEAKKAVKRAEKADRDWLKTLKKVKIFFK